MGILKRAVAWKSCLVLIIFIYIIIFNKYLTASDEAREPGGLNISSAVSLGSNIDLKSLRQIQNLKEPAASYWNAAVKGSGEAACHLADCYAKGKGVVQSDTQAEFWGSIAAEAGFPGGEGIIGCMYMGSSGHPVNQNKARKWCERGARDGDPLSQVMLAAFLSEEGGEQNNKEAFYWLLTAAERRSGPAAALLASCYQQGTEGAPKSWTMAYLWSLLASSYGDLNPSTASDNKSLQEDGEFWLTSTQIGQLKQRRDEIIQYQKQFDSAWVDDGPKETMALPPGGTEGQIIPNNMGIIKINVNFEGTGSHDFLIDTGSTLSVISPQLADELHLPVTGLAVTSIKQLQPTPLLMASGKIFGAQFKNLRFAKIEIPKILGVEGVLGGNFIRLLRLAIAVKHQSIWLGPPGPKVANGIPLAFQGGVPFVQTRIESQRKGYAPVLLHSRLG